MPWKIWPPPPIITICTKINDNRIGKKVQPKSSKIKICTTLFNNQKKREKYIRKLGTSKK